MVKYVKYSCFGIEYFVCVQGFSLKCHRKIFIVILTVHIILIGWVKYHYIWLDIIFIYRSVFIILLVQYPKFFRNQNFNLFQLGLFKYCVKTSKYVLKNSHFCIHVIQKEFSYTVSYMYHISNYYSALIIILKLQ